MLQLLSFLHKYLRFYDFVATGSGIPHIHWKEHLVGIGFGIVFLALTILELLPFSMLEIGRDSYFRVT